ncbi:hypothetical protein AAD018_006320 [Aestuariibius insulae]|uniref:hypothetical protein n=1 Tax=Aestuariibius insulae TaxID=2058287 RepID=UPI00345F06E9
MTRLLVTLALLAAWIAILALFVPGSFYSGTALGLLIAFLWLAISALRRRKQS